MSLFFSSLRLSFSFVSILAVLPASLQAQQPPWPNGCSVAGGTQWIQQGLDDIFLGACNRHDQCWAQCNGPNPPFLDFGHKLQCDAELLAEAEAACLVWAGVLAFPFDDLDDAEEFLDYCSAAAAALVVGVSTPIGTGYYWESQCTRGCNPDGCSNAGLLYPPSCGNGKCFVVFNYDPCWLNPLWPWCDPCLYEPSLPQCQEECVLNPANCPVSPIIVDLGSDGIRLSGARPPVGFDVDADGTPDLTSWTRRNADESFLVLDRNHNGAIDDGTELFGSAVTLQTGASAVHGFEALQELDRVALGGNENGRLDPEDALFLELQLWRDDNRDGDAAPWELQSLSDAGIVSIELQYDFTPNEDVWGNSLSLWSSVSFSDGRQCRAVDVFFARN